MSVQRKRTLRTSWWILPGLLALLFSGCGGPLSDNTKIVVSTTVVAPTIVSTPIPAASDTIEPSTPVATLTQPPPTIAPTLVPGADGAIESLALITSTANSEYFTLTYWSDGLRVNGFLGRPKDGGDGVYPAIIYNRGGYGRIGALEGWEVALFVEAGYVAVASQYRGNVGSEGEENFGGADVNDVLNLVPLLEQLPYVDPERIGMMGHSRGGMMTYLALKQETLAGTHHIKVAATVGGVADLIMWYEDGYPYIVSIMGGRPQDEPVAYKARSATCWPELINVPLLIQHGEADVRVSVEQSRKLARVLKEAGKSVKLITFPGDDHPLSGHRGGVPEALAWFQKYLSHPGEDRSFESHKRAIGEVKTWFQNSYR